MIAEEHAPEAAPTTGDVRVAWVGAVPPWLGEVAAGVPGVSLSFASGFSGPFAPAADVSVIHVTGAGASEIASARAAFRSAKLVLGLGDDVDLSSDTHAAVEAADAVVVGSAEAQRAVARAWPAAAARTSVVSTPIDLSWFAPEATLLKTRGAPLKRFQRFHRIAPPVALFVGPYTREGGLDVAIDAAYRLRETHEDMRLAAIPLGATDQDWLDECERKALGLGHRGIVEWAPEEDEIPFWYATATVVFTPWRSEGPGLPARLAAAAGRPYLATGAHVDAVVEQVGRLVADRAEADRIGAEARARVEQELAPATCATALAAVWRQVAG